MSETRVGTLLHDRALFDARKERGHEGNIEVLLRTPRWTLFEAV